MRPKILTAAGLVLAFLIGAMANGMYTVRTRAFDLEEEKSVALEKNPQPSLAVSRTHLVQPKAQPRVVYASSPAPAANPVRPAQKKRTLAKEVLIVGGSAGAGAAIGAVAGGKKGAAVG